MNSYMDQIGDILEPVECDWCNERFDRSFYYMDNEIVCNECLSTEQYPFKESLSNEDRNQI